MELFEQISETPLTSSLSSLLQKSVKNLVDNAQFLSNNQLFVNKFKTSIQKLQAMLGPELKKCRPISDLMKEDPERKFKDISEYDPN